MMQASETRRIREHLDGAIEQLDARGSHGLDRATRLTRSLLRAELALYRDRGVFPLNHDHASRRPAFIDDHGTRCAMAHLMELGGAGDLVAEVARRTNHAYVDELAGEPRFLAWLESAGLTVEEAARIQPGYDMSAARCLCVVAPRESGQPVPGVIEATIIAGASGADSTLEARVDVVHGTAPFAVGATMKVVGASSGAVGDRVLVPIPQDHKTETPYPWLTTIEANGIVGAVCNPPYSNWSSAEIGYLEAGEVVALRGEASQSTCEATLAAKDKCFAEPSARRASSTPGICVYGSPSSSSSSSGAVDPPKSPGADPGSDTTTPPSTSATADDTSVGCATSAAPANQSSVAVLLAVVGALVARQARHKSGPGV